MNPFIPLNRSLNENVRSPLTLTLSHREREQLPTRSGKRTAPVAIAALSSRGMKTSRAAARVCIALARRMILALPEPTPLPACGHPLPALRGKGRERGDRFMAPTHVQFLKAFPLHQPAPSPLPSPPMGERVAGGRV